MADWSLLPTSLVDHVAGLLTVPDQMRMAVACKSWREAMVDGLCRRRPAPSIWIILRDGFAKPFHNSINEFASFSEGMRRSYFLPMPSRKFGLVGSSRGWMMLQDELHHFQAFHPISRTSITFPKTNVWIDKAVFVPLRRGRRGGSERPALAAILAEIAHSTPPRGLSFACVGDKVWTALPMPAGIYFVDIVVCEGKLYALGNENQVMIVDLDGEEPTSSFLETVEQSGRARTSDEYFHTNHIGVISGEIIIVRVSGGTVCPPLTVNQFEVSRLQKDKESRWKWVTTKDLAGHAIMYDYEGVIVLPVGDHVELQADCIYCIHGGGAKVSLSVINLKSETVSVILPSFYYFSSWIPQWFLP